MNLFIDEVRTWSGFEMITQKLEQTVEKFEELGKKIYETNNAGAFEGFNVLNHGDFHFNNMLFKKNDEGKISDVLFVSKSISNWQDFNFSNLFVARFSNDKVGLANH